ncbi:2Fe-2S iron-sulfur cluster-binding protein [Streptomyces sp. NPDC002577]
MAKVRVEPTGVEFDVRTGESVAEAAWRLGYTWPTNCWGQAECMVCFVMVVDGELQTEPPEENELRQLRTRLPVRLRSPLTRLACRLKINGAGVVLEKKGVQRPATSENHDQAVSEEPE